jgi:hypothetical protein
MAIKRDKEPFQNMLYLECENLTSYNFPATFDS